MTVLMRFSSKFEIDPPTNVNRGILISDHVDNPDRHALYVYHSIQIAAVVLRHPACRRARFLGMQRGSTGQISKVVKRQVQMPDQCDSSMLVGNRCPRV